MRFLRSTRTYRGLALLWTAGMVAAFSLPPTSLPRVQSSLGPDKLVHCGLFLGFAILWMRVLCPPSAGKTAACLWTCGVRFLGGGLFVAIGAELYQQVIPVARTADAYDAIANGVGLLAGLLLYVALVRWRPTNPLASASDRASE